jgi:hypothetical protein
LICLCRPNVHCDQLLASWLDPKRKGVSKRVRRGGEDEHDDLIHGFLCTPISRLLDDQNCRREGFGRGGIAREGEGTGVGNCLTTYPNRSISMSEFLHCRARYAKKDVRGEKKGRRTRYSRFERRGDYILAAGEDRVYQKVVSSSDICMIGSKCQLVQGRRWH